MKKLEMIIRPLTSQADLQERIMTWAKRNDATVRPMGRLARPYKTEGESMHWHVTGIRKGMGTVEVTYLPSTGRLTVSVHDNRQGIWAGRAYENMAQEIKEQEG